MGVEEKKREKRNRLLKAGTGLFSERGFGATTVNDITQRAGVAKGTFYLYFQDKRQLLTEILHDLASQHEENYRQLRTVPCPRERLKHYVMSELNFYKENADLARFTVTGIGPEAPSLLNWYVDTQKRHIGFLRETILEGSEKGLFAVQDVTKAARFLRGAIFMFLAHQVFNPEGPQDIPSNADLILRIFLEGVGTGTDGSPIP